MILVITYFHTTVKKFSASVRRTSECLLLDGLIRSYCKQRPCGITSEESCKPLIKPVYGLPISYSLSVRRICDYYSSFSARKNDFSPVAVNEPYIFVNTCFCRIFFCSRYGMLICIKSIDLQLFVPVHCFESFSAFLFPKGRRDCFPFFRHKTAV